MLAVRLPLVSLITVVYLEFRIFSQIFEKFEIAPRKEFGTQGKMIHERNLEVKNLATSTLLVTLALYSKESWLVITKTIRKGDKILTL
jgi:hypothetical protein